MISVDLPRDSYPWLLNLDYKIYPTENSLLVDQLETIIAPNVEFTFMLKQDDSEFAVASVFALKPTEWHRLITGEISEADLTTESMFNIETDSSLALHVYHIEKLDVRSTERVWPHFLSALKEKATVLREKNPAIDIVGFSGLTASPSGFHLFSSKFGCLERNYKCSEKIFKHAVTGDLYVSNDEESVPDSMIFICSCKMLVLYPGEKSIVWDFLNK